MGNGLIYIRVIDSGCMKTSSFSRFLIPAVAVLILGLFSCSSTGRVYISSGGSGEAAVSINLSPLVLRYAGDIAGGFSAEQPEGNLRIFDTEKLRTRLNAIDGVDLIAAADPAPDRFSFSFSFEHIGNLFPSKDSSAGNVLTFTRKNGIKTLVFNLNAGNFSSVTGFLGFGNDEIMETFGPQTGEPYSKEDYLELVEFLFDEYASKETIDTIMEEAVIRFSLSVEGKNLAIEGDSPVVSSVKGAEGTVEVPLIAFLTLSKPVVFRAEWE